MRRVFLILLLVCSVRPCRADDVWLQVRESKLRSQPIFYASAVASVRYGDRLTKLSEANGWARVKAGGAEGYLHLSAISRQQILLSAKDVSKVTANSPDVVLASKGFSREIESNLKRQDSAARYDLVDKVEQSPRLSSAEVNSFIVQGELAR